MALRGTLLLTEAVIISPTAVGLPQMPGIWSEPQIAAWRQIVDAVHTKGSYIFCQLAHFGRAALPEFMAQRGLDIVGPSAIPMNSTSPTPRALSESEIRGVVADFALAAQNAVEKAGFDGVEIHGANGYLVDQFIQDMSNQRSDVWGASVQNRSRFALEIAKAVVGAVGESRTGIRLSPWSAFQNMRMADPLSQFEYLVNEFADMGLAYIHLIEPQVAADSTAEMDDSNLSEEGSNVSLVEAWSRTSRPALLAGGFTAQTARDAVEKTYRDQNVAVVFGRHFTSNPDLVFRIKTGIKLTPYERAAFYDMGNPQGYVTYAFSDEFLQVQAGA
ncbi:hypothetical protein N0V83_009643 [Neocucurbitaria cava]|uniref:NADH:flavin oxidoreductase/NADH oxidase N-terminal domain-containing protein n=1 Tax=Neocucurbitaria cava TaxID=798079 RepID=A0A9W9CHR1_9PLEO|nr:hypothetical protein N0V83_009643 [Neocucurbitaria cava]